MLLLLLLLLNHCWCLVPSASSLRSRGEGPALRRPRAAEESHRPRWRRSHQHAASLPPVATTAKPAAVIIRGGLVSSQGDDDDDDAAALLRCPFPLPRRGAAALPPLWPSRSEPQSTAGELRPPLSGPSATEAMVPQRNCSTGET